MKRRKLRGQSVAEFLISFLFLWAMFLLVYGVCAMWNARVNSVRAVVDGVCREAVSAGTGVSIAHYDMESIYPGQDIGYTVSMATTGEDKLQKVVLTSQGNFIATWLFDAFARFLPNSSPVKAVATCPEQKFVPR